ncbi:MBL fold metallo-hydrolase [Stackebrandtia nassauensis]|uniref:Beta-lactamase domain protein n=1 Tax=Stackebrandtia nassauensis (strain DSM 44728 / CIP 108903 / NRRL B-16338 / NBRC 102104 / LLR-40K-21) TaxID=446470 RepID=D3PV56_STANL|nr:MBL fold metallo-hydrolase [Stackebrandtia nassauensis]ADD41109.1 beta-lactamase domain protein [Stackebrandtia nassauensis DSM 44728]
MRITVEKVITSGVFTLDGGSWDVDNNVWLIGTDTEVLVIDAAHDSRAIAKAVGDRRVSAIVCTHAHNDHVNAAPKLARALSGEVPILLHPDDRVLWDQTHPDRAPDADLSDGQTLTIGGLRLEVLHTPGHAPGAVCLYAPQLGAVFTGDTLFEGGPGATGRSHSDRDTLVASIKAKLMELPPETVVHTGHGPDTTIGAEADNLT